MTNSTKTSAHVLDLGLIASLAAFSLVLVNADNLAPSLASALLFVLAVAVTFIGVKREAAKEAKLDEVELAGASFGARWGIAVVIFLTFLVTFLPPLQNTIAALVDLRADDGSSPIPAAALLFAAGLVTAMFVQLTSAFVIGKFWIWSKR